MLSFSFFATRFPPMRHDIRPRKRGEGVRSNRRCRSAEGLYRRVLRQGCFIVTLTNLKSLENTRCFSLWIDPLSPRPALCRKTDLENYADKQTIHSIFTFYKIFLLLRRHPPPLPPPVNSLTTCSLPPPAVAFYFSLCLCVWQITPFRSVFWKL